MMRMPSLFGLATAAMLALAACTASPPAATQKTVVGLDQLFDQLRSAASEEEAMQVQVAIIKAWSSSGRADIDALIGEGTKAMQMGELGRAAKFFDEVVARAPDFAEGYNLRAANHVMRNDFKAAMTDIERVLRLEPRHFGALSGLGHIFMMMHQERAALKAFDAALAVNPHLSAIRAEADKLRNQVAGVAI